MGAFEIVAIAIVAGVGIGGVISGSVILLLRSRWEREQRELDERLKKVWSSRYGNP